MSEDKAILTAEGLGFRYQGGGEALASVYLHARAGELL